MRNRLRRYYRRHEPGGIRIQQLKSGVGAAVAIFCLGALSHWAGMPYLIAPFGASAVLLFGQARSPLAQPANVLGGYLVASLMTFVLLGLFPGSLVAAAIAVGLAITVMLLLRVSHPPAGAIPLVAFLGNMGLVTLAEVVAAGSILMLGMAMIHHRLPPSQHYPLHLD